jgi:hypothetical protein
MIQNLMKLDRMTLSRECDGLTFIDIQQQLVIFAPSRQAVVVFRPIRPEIQLSDP